jgi:predicted sulfurtransferase
MSEEQGGGSFKKDEKREKHANQKRRRLNRTEQKRLSKLRKKQKTSRVPNASCNTSSAMKPSARTTEAQRPPPPQTKPHNEYLLHYVAFPSPETKRGHSLTTSVTDNLQNDDTENPALESCDISKVSSVGKWFPKAIQLKRPLSCIQEPPKGSPAKKQAALLLFYQYITPIPWNETQYRRIHDYLLHIGLYRVNVAGRIRISKEGLNATLSAVDYVAADYDDAEKTTPRNYDRYCADAVTTLHYLAEDLRRWDATAFTPTDFKYISDLTPDRHFTSFQLIPVQELVYYGGLNDKNASIVQHGGQHVSPTEFHQLLAGADLPPAQVDNPATPSIPEEDAGKVTFSTQKGKKDIVVIDVRNHYEAAIGRFDGQEVAVHPHGAAQYVDPKLRQSTDFPTWVQDHAEDLRQKDRILLYCTGGIRCERASAHLTAVLSSAAQKKVPEIYQLQGGIEKYLQTFPDGGFWRGKNFTFDKREAIGVENWNGDGGVVLKQKAVPPATTKDTATAAGPPDRTPACVICQVFWDRYLGKKKCGTCGVPILVCAHCLSTVGKTKMQQSQCPLCVEEHIPVKAASTLRNGIPSSKVVAGDAVQKKWGGRPGPPKSPRVGLH